MEECKQNVDTILNTTPDYIGKIQSDVDVNTTKPFKCAVLSCSNLYHEHYGTADEELYKFHKFPADAATCEIWKRQCGLPETTNTDASMVCSEHFLLDDYERNYKEEFRNPSYRRPLKLSAIPTQKLSGAPVHYIEVVDNNKPTAEVKLEDQELYLREKLKELQRRIHLKKKSIQSLNREIDKLRSNTLNDRQRQKGALRKVFSDAQIGVLRGRKKVVWSDDDLAMAFSLRHMSSRECYLYLKYTLNMPLPSLSCVQRWAASCAVYGCDSSEAPGDQQSTTLQFHSFPKDSQVLQRWLTACVWKEDVQIETSQICSLHFTPDSYTDPTQLDCTIPYTNVLKENTVPTLNLIKSNEITDDIDVPEKVSPQEHVLYVQTVKEETTRGNDSIEQLKEAINKAQDEYNELCGEYKEKQRIVQNLRGKRLTANEETKLLRKVFSESQIKILNGKKMIHWTNDDMVVGYTIRHMSSKRCYLYLSKNLNIPLPGLSSIKRWATIKK